MKRIIGLLAIPFVAMSSMAAQNPASSSTTATAKIDLLVPDEIKPTGQHGTVILEGDVSNGRTANLAVAASSKAPLIDQFVLERFSDKRIADDMLVNSPAKVRLEVKVYNTKGLDFGTNYTCAQAVLDHDWHHSVSPNEGIERTPLYKMIKVAGGPMMADKRFAFTKDANRYDGVWAATIEACRTVPNEGFTETLIDTGRK